MAAADVAVQQPQQAQDQQVFEEISGQQGQYVMQAPMPQGVVYAQAPQAVAYAAQPMQYTYMAPLAGQVMNAGAEARQQVVLQDGQQYAGGVEAQQVLLEDGQQVVLQGGQFSYAAEAQQAMVQEGQVVHHDMQFDYAAPEGAEVHAGAEVQRATFVGTPVVAAAPARVNVSPEIFSKLAAGGQLTPDEMAELSGQPAPGQPALPPKQPTPEAADAAPPAAGAPSGVAPGSTEAADKSDKKDKKDETGSKESLKASKKKSKGCC